MRNKTIIFLVMFFLILLCANISFANTEHTIHNTSLKLEDGTMISDLNIESNPIKINNLKGEKLTFNKLKEGNTQDNISKKIVALN